MLVLVINSGSSSLKFQLIDMETEKVLAKGLCDKIGLKDSFFKYKTHTQGELVVNLDMPDHTAAVEISLEYLSHKEHGVLESLSEISAIGHRVLHGGEYFHKATIVNQEVTDAIDICSELGPLHNPPNLIGIKVCQKLLPDTPNVAVFDTAFHQTIPKQAYMYGIPYKFYEKYKIRRYGFHGPSHNYVSQVAAKLSGKPIESLKIISCHLGNGASVCAISQGKSIDTSMGLTPLEGLLMGTRSGNIDPAIVPFLMEKENLSPNQMTSVLNKESGILGISGVSRDFRDILKAADENNPKAILAKEIFCYTIKKYIGQYSAILNGVDIIIFTGGVGENSWQVRKSTLENLDYLGVNIDDHLNINLTNKTIGTGAEITAQNSKVRTFVIPTNEELMIARDTMKIVSA